MKKLFIYPLWSVCSVEKFLEIMECNGFRLKRIYFRYLFEFAKSASKCVHYTYSYSFMKDYEMHRYEYELRKQFNAEKIPAVGLGGTSIHRICLPNVDLTDFKGKRNRYILKLLRSRSLFAIICLLGSFSAYIAYRHVLSWLWIIAFFFGILLAYYTVCYVLVKDRGQGQGDGLREPY